MRDRARRITRAGEALAERWLARLAGGGFDAMISRGLAVGSAEVRMPDGRVRRFDSGVPGPRAILDIHRARALHRMVFGGGLGFARSWVDCDWETPDLAAVMELGSANRHSVGGGLRGRSLARAADRLRHLLRANTQRQARRNIALHYDLGNDFYAAWLDETMTYSSAIFEGGANSLADAQRHKYRRLLDLLDARPGDHILEIGAGWGGFAELAARERGVRVTGLTLSREQLRYARERIARADLADRVDFALRDYRDERGRYDHAVSIEMFEAVGERYWPVFFRKLRDVLRPGGRAALQIITIEEALFPAYRRGADFIQSYIFPGGMLPSPGALRREAAAAGLVWRASSTFARSYARTLAEWRRQFDAAFDGGRLPADFDRTFRRIWDFYLAYCEGGFRGGSIDVAQIALARH